MGNTPPKLLLKLIMVGILTAGGGCTKSTYLSDTSAEQQIKRLITLIKTKRPAHDPTLRKEIAETAFEMNERDTEWLEMHAGLMQRLQLGAPTPGGFSRGQR